MKGRARVDVHAHVYPHAFLDLLEDTGQLSRRGDKIVVKESNHPNATEQEIHQGMWDKNLRIKVMDRLGTRMQVVSVGTPWLNYIPRTRSKEAARIVNSAIAEEVRGSPLRLAGLGVLAVNSPVDGIEEIDYALDELGLKGFIVSTNIGGKPVFDTKFSKLLDHCARRNVVLFIHPVAFPDSRVYYRAAMTSIHFPAQTSTAAFGLLKSGFFHRNPHAKVLLSHVGGLLPFILGRLSRDAETYFGDRKLRDDVSNLAELFYIDTLSYYTPALDYALKEWGPKKVMFGTDYPFAWGDNWVRVVQVVDNTDTTQKQRALIFSENALRLFKL